MREQQHDAANDAEELEARRKELAKRLGAKQDEKDRYVRTSAQGHISEEELDAYLVELKKQIDNLRVLLASIEVELSESSTSIEASKTLRLSICFFSSTR